MSEPSPPGQVARPPPSGEKKVILIIEPTGDVLVIYAAKTTPSPATAEERTALCAGPVVNLVEPGLGIRLVTGLVRVATVTEPQTSQLYQRSAVSVPSFWAISDPIAA